MPKNIGVLLESMWGWGGFNDAGEEAPRYFRINPDNFSGRRLYRLCGDTPFLVTNSCKIVQATANHHGTPDPKWVSENLKFLESQGMSLLLVCGKVANKTFHEALKCYVSPPHIPSYSFILMDHPAARRWSNEKLDAMTLRISQELAR